MASPAAGDPIIGFLKSALERQPARVIHFKGFLGSHSQAFISRECDLAHSSPPGSSLSPLQEAAMTLQPHRLEFKSHWLESIFGMVLAMAVATILTITTWAAPRIPESDSAAPISPIYRSNHPILY
jgi:hypothetical protein